MNKKKVSKKKINKRQVAKWLWIVLTAPIIMLVFLLILTAIGVFGKLPSFEELENPKSNLSTEIYSEDGVLMGSFFFENRSYVDYSELNDSLVAALVSTEDMRFYSHSGIDFISLARVGVKTFALGKKEQGGGSTITQQLAKNLFPRDTVLRRTSFSRNSRLFISKLKEWITAVKLEHNYTKEEIIAMYFNTVEFGSNAYGIKSAAKTFFNKLPSELTVNESAMLVGVVNAPTKYSPVRNPNNALGRRNTVLSRMQEAGFLKKKERDSLAGLPIELDYMPITHNEGVGTYFREMLRIMMTAKKPNDKNFSSDWDYKQAMKEWETNPLYGWCEKNLKSDGTPYNIYRDGLKIYTTLNATMQGYAEESLNKQLKEKVQPEIERQYKNTGVLHRKLSKEHSQRLLNNAMRSSDRYRNLRNKGVSEAQIEKDFDTPTPMKIYTFDGEVDTVMTPRDSIFHHKKIMKASFVAMDPYTGHVKAYVGGPNFRYFKYDMVRQGKRQIGSTAKPFVYAFGLDYLGLTPCTYVQNVPVTMDSGDGKVWTPKEANANPYDGEYKPLYWGLANSRNNFSAWIMKQSGQPAALADFMHRMGIKSYINPVPAVALGTPDVSLNEMVAAYVPFVNKGIYTEPMFVTRIEDRYGNLIATFTSEAQDVLSEQTAYTMLQMLERVVNAGTAGRLKWMYGFTGEMGGKTGTTNDNKDAWFIGVIPQLVAGAWVGGEDPNISLARGGEGAALALPIYAEFLKKVYADPRLGITQGDKFIEPPGAEKINCASSQRIYDEFEIYSTEEDEFFDY